MHQVVQLNTQLGAFGVDLGFILKIKEIKRTKKSMAFNGIQIKTMFMLSDSDDLNGLQMAILPYLAMHIAWIDETKFKPIIPIKNQSLAHKQ